MSYQNLLLLGAALPSYDDDKKDKENVVNMDDPDNEKFLNEINY